MGNEYMIPADYLGGHPLGGGSPKGVGIIYDSTYDSLIDPPNRTITSRSTCLGKSFYRFGDNKYVNVLMRLKQHIGCMKVPSCESYEDSLYEYQFYMNGI